MPSEVEAVVIGAGALGLSVGYHLAKLGRQVVIIDQFAPGSQTSPRAAGLFKLIQGDEARTRLAQRSIRIVSDFEKETGVTLPVSHSGSLIVARTPQHAALVRAEAERSADWGVELALIDPADANEFAPFLEPDEIRVACHTPGDIYIEEPSSLLQAYVAAAQLRGARILGNTRVTGIRLRDREVDAVVTSDSELSTPVVIDAAGAWARQVGRLARTTVPLVPVRHQLLITQQLGGIEADQAIVRLIDTAVYVRPARGGLMLGGFEADPLALNMGSQPKDFSIAEVPLDLSVLKRLGATVEANVPALRNAGVQDHRGGLFTMTPDGQLIVGPDPAVRGLWIATGCNGSGFSLSPAIGEQLAEWIVGGEPSIDMTACAPVRFSSEHFNDDQLREKGVWQYTQYYEPASPAVITPSPWWGG